MQETDKSVGNGRSLTHFQIDWPSMNDAEDLCGCLACFALCGVCCVAAAEEDKRERERAAVEAYQQLKTPVIHPVAVSSPRAQKAFYEENARAQKKGATQLSHDPPAY
ncbi:hypothetical protein Poli38472_008380 [Pythium oligandrum]|uniref:Uncharacterized protein n=1 Tax=Pythium oligandrum TaxID=41045 RepID=A0A8K1CNY2_PYTOL|nr:hypothetical protein Poli38472_008380 [Pythium oligandrum]|eukprot:TMW65738.1 hypothetical protein Poli38472_008380 [Pythium oligandrum]